MFLCVVQKDMCVRLNHSTNLISKPFCKAKVNSASQIRTRAVVHYDTFRLWEVTYDENLQIILFYWELCQDLNSDFIPRLMIEYDTK